MRPYIVPFIVLSLILQGSLVSFPLVFISLTLIAIKKKENYIFALAFVLGLILDSFYFKPLGATSIFFLVFLFAIFTYERKFEIDNPFFIFISSFLGGMCLFLIFGDSNILLKSLITAIFTVFLFQVW